MPNITLITQPFTALTKKQLPDGKWENACPVYDAIAKNIQIDLSGLSALLDNLNQDQALMLAAREELTYRIITASAVGNGVLGIARTKDNFEFSPHTSLMLLDIDYHQWPHGEIDEIKVLQKVIGNFGYVIRASTTSNIRDSDGTVIGGGTGCHIYVTVKHGTEIPKLLQVIHQRLVLAGYGFVFVSESGAQSIRTMVDRTVGSPERVIFEAPPVLINGYSQERSSNYFEGPELEVKSLSEDEEKELKKLENSLLTGAQPKVEQAKKAWRDARGLSQGEAEKILSNRKLPCNFVINNNDNSTFDVAAVWKDPEKYHGLAVRDPFEPEYGKSKAKIFVNRDAQGSIESIFINSMAHGGNNNYRLEKPAELLFEGVDTKLFLDSSAEPHYCASSIADTLTDLSHQNIAEKLGYTWFYNNARYVSTIGKWFLWDGSAWRVDKKLTHLSKINDYLKNVSKELKASIAGCDDKSKIRSIYRDAKDLKSAPMRNNIELIIKSDPKCASLMDIFDSNEKLLGTPQGTVDLQLGTLYPSRREDYISRLTNVSPNSKVPKQWLLFLNTLFDADSEIISFIQRVCGYMLTGLNVEEKLFFLYGTGANGKSKFLETLIFIMGDFARRVPATLFLEQRNEQHPTCLAGLQHARLAIGSELPSDKTWNEQIIKDLTGGDTITARLMRQDFFDFKPQFKIFIAGNHQPTLKNVDESIARRVMLIPFKVTIPKENRDNKLGDKLKAEAGSILKWCIDGAVNYFEMGLKPPQSITDASHEYIKSEDVIGEFLESWLIPNSEARVGFDGVYDSYRQWMEIKGYRVIKLERELRKELKKRNIKVGRSNNRYWLYGYQQLSFL